MSAPRYEWVMGPTMVMRPDKIEFNAGKEKLVRKGASWFLVGQVRDIELKGQVLNWCMRASKDYFRARVQRRDAVALWPRAADWMGRTPMEGTFECPKGWTFAEFGTGFERGLVI